MKSVFLNKIWILSMFIMLCSCADSQSLSGSKNQKARALFGEALQHYDVAEYEQALNKLDKALKKDPQFIQALDLKSRIYQETKQIDKAITTLQSILAFNPQYKFALFDLAQIYFDKGDYDECSNYLRGLRDLKANDQPLYNQYKFLQANAEFAKKAIQHPVPFDPQNMGPMINSKYEEYIPGLTLDESKFFFTRRDASVNIRIQNEDLYVATSTSTADDKNKGWSKAESIGPPVNTQDNEGAFTTTVDGKYILFTACNRPGGRGSCDIWFTHQKGDKWQNPRNMGSPINSPDWESQPSMGADGQTLYFTSNRMGGFGGTDIWKSELKNGRWSKPINLGPKINTAGDEQFPFIHPDGKTLYYTSDGLPGMGKSDIYFCKLEDGAWTDPINIGYPINTAGEEWNFIVNRTGTKAYFSSNGIEDSYGGMDIYSFDLYEAARPGVVSYVQGSIKDQADGKPLRAVISLIDLQSGKIVVEARSDEVDGSFLTTLPSNGNYALHVRKDGYLFHSENFQLKTTSLEKPHELEVKLKKIEVGKTIVLQNVFFETNEYALLPESKSELQTLVNFMKDNPEIKVRIKGHTDNVGDDNDNLVLSQNRAKSVFDYIVANGIPADRLEHEGYGETKPIASNDTEEGRAENRRTEFEIIR